MKAATLQSPGIERPNGTEFTHSIVASKGALAIALAVGVALALATWPLYSEVSLWLAPVIVVMTGVLAHMIVASSFLPPFPHICVLFSGLQLILMAWFARDHPPEDPTFDIGLGTGNYLSYAAPLWLAYTIGWFSPLWRAAPEMQRFDAICARTGDLLKRDLDVLLFSGLAITVVIPFVNVSAVAFLLVLLANLKFVGAAGWLLMRYEGWLWRVGLALLTEIVLSTDQAMFGRISPLGSLIHGPFRLSKSC